MAVLSACRAAPTPPRPASFNSEFDAKERAPAFDKAQGQHSEFNSCLKRYLSLCSGLKCAKWMSKEGKSIAASIISFSTDWLAVFLSCQDAQRKHHLRQLTFHIEDITPLHLHFLANLQGIIYSCC